MDDIARLLRRASRRLLINRFLHALPLGLGLAAVALFLAVVSQRLLATPLNWAVAGPAAAIAGVALAAVFALVRQRSEATVARLLDDAADLRQSLSTAVCVSKRDDAWSRAAVEDARGRARRVVLRDVLPWRFPRLWPAPLAAGLALFLAWLFVPQADLFGAAEAAEAQREQREELNEAKAETESIDRELQELLAKAGERRQEIDQADAERPKPATPDEVRRAAIRKLTSAAERVEQLRQQGDPAALNKIRDKMRQIRQPGLGPANELTSALQRGDFKAASENLRELMDQMAAGDLTPEQRRRLQEQLKNLAEQMDRLAQRRKELEEALKRAGLNPNLAGDPNKAQQAIQQAQNLTPEQRQRLMDMAGQAAQSNQRMGQMAQALGQAAQQLQQGGQGAQALGELGGQLNALEMMEAELEALKAAENFAWGKIDELSQCLGGGQGSVFHLWGRRKSSKGLGAGAGGAPGQGPESRVETDARKARAPSEYTGGPIIGSAVVQGEAVRGESRAQFAEIVESGGQAAADAIESKQVPREYHDALKHYFGRLEAKAKGQPAGEEAPAEGESGAASDKPSDSNSQ